MADVDAGRRPGGLSVETPRTDVRGSGRGREPKMSLALGRSAILDSSSSPVIDGGKKGAGGTPRRGVSAGVYQSTPMMPPGSQLPNFLVIGTAKAGTTSLCRSLRSEQR